MKKIIHFILILFISSFLYSQNVLIETIEFFDLINNNSSIENYYYDNNNLLVKINGVCFYGSEKDYYTIEIKYQGNQPIMFKTTWPGTISILNNIKIINSSIFYDYQFIDTRYSQENIEVKEKDLDLNADINGNVFLFDDMYTPSKDSIGHIRCIGININSGKIIIHNNFAKQDEIESSICSWPKVVLIYNNEYEIYLDEIVIASFEIEKFENYMVYNVKDYIKKIIAKLIIKYKKEYCNTFLIIDDA